MVRVKRVYGYPYKFHKRWGVLVETEDHEIVSAWFKKHRSAKRFYERYGGGY